MSFMRYMKRERKINQRVGLVFISCSNVKPSRWDGMQAHATQFEAPRGDFESVHYCGCGGTVVRLDAGEVAVTGHSRDPKTRMIRKATYNLK
jgi:hypothetical protein